MPPFKVKAPVVIFKVALALKVVLVNTTVLATPPLIVSTPFCMVPAVNIPLPDGNKVNPPISRVPLVIVIFAMIVFAFKIQVCPPVTIVTLSPAFPPGIPLGVQLLATFQAVDVAPFHV